VTKITGIAPEPLLHIVANLRPEDQEEIDAVRGVGFDQLRLALQFCQLAATCGAWIFWRGDTGEPAAVLGAYAMTPAVAGCWAFGTSSWPRVIGSVTRHARRVMVPALLQAGFHRAECRALLKREDTKLWLTSLGWKAEAVLSEFGVRHEDFTLFAWLADEQPDYAERPQIPRDVQLRDRE
jgi:hypothetical protein